MKKKSLMELAKEHFPNTYFTARDFDMATGIDYKIAAMVFTKAVGTGKIGRSTTSGITRFYLIEQ